MAAEAARLADIAGWAHGLAGGGTRVRAGVAGLAQELPGCARAWPAGAGSYAQVTGYGRACARGLRTWPGRACAGCGRLQACCTCCGRGWPTVAGLWRPGAAVAVPGRCWAVRMGPELQVAAAGRPGSRRAWRCVRRPAVAGGGAWRPEEKFFFSNSQFKKLNLLIPMPENSPRLI